MSWDGTRLGLSQVANQNSSTKRLPTDPTIGFFWSLLTAQVVCWTILPQWTQPNVPAETLEVLTAGRELAWGYPHQPPLGVWLASAFCWLTAPQVWPVYLLSQICAAVSCWSAWTLGRKFLHPWTALCAAIVLLGGYTFTVSSAAFTGAHLAGCFWSLAILSFHEALTQPRRRYWVATGVCLGLGLLSSYATFLLLAAMIVFTFWDVRARRCLDSSWPFLALLSMAVLLLPHVMWLTRNNFQTVVSGLDGASSVAERLMNPLAFFGAQLLSVVPVVILLVPLIGWFSLKESASEGEDDREFARRMLLWLTCLPFVVIFVVSIWASRTSGIFVGVSVCTYLGIVLLMWSHLEENRLAWRDVILRTGAAAGFFVALLVGLNLMFPQLRREGTSTLFPGPELAHSLEQAWTHSGQSGPIPVLQGPADMVHNALWYSGRSAPRLAFDDLSSERNRAAADATLLKTGGMVVWHAQADDGATLAQLNDRFFGQLSVLNPQSLKWQSSGNLEPLRVGMAIVHPQTVQPIKTALPFIRNTR